MSTFSVDNKASEQIRRIFAQSNCRDPVAEILEIRYATDGEDKLRTIHILARERSDVPPEELCEVSGIVFVRGAVEAFPDFCLTFDGERMLLRDPSSQPYSSLQSALDARRRSLSSPIGTAAEAIEAARSAWAEVFEKTHVSGFSKEDWARFEPYSATLENGLWILTGTVPANCPGQAYLTTVRASDGAVSVRVNR